MSSKPKISDILKEAGLEIAEDTAASAVKAMVNALPKIIKLSENKLDDLLLPILEVVNPKLLEMLDEWQNPEPVETDEPIAPVAPVE